MRRRPTTSPGWPEAKGVRLARFTACILDRPRHARLIEAVRADGGGDPADRRRRRGRHHPYDRARRDRHRHLISAPAARRRACWRPPRCAASAARCRGRLQINTGGKARAGPSAWAFRTRSRVYSMERDGNGTANVACSPPPESPTAALLAGVKFRGAIRGECRLHTIVLCVPRPARVCARSRPGAPGSGEVLSLVEVSHVNLGRQRRLAPASLRFVRVAPRIMWASCSQGIRPIWSVRRRFMSAPACSSSLDFSHQDRADFGPGPSLSLSTSADPSRKRC